MIPHTPVTALYAEGEKAVGYPRQAGAGAKRKGSTLLDQFVSHATATLLVIEEKVIGVVCKMLRD